MKPERSVNGTCPVCMCLAITCNRLCVQQHCECCINWDVEVGGDDTVFPTGEAA